MVWDTKNYENSFLELFFLSHPCTVLQITGENLKVILLQLPLFLLVQMQVSIVIFPCFPPFLTLLYLLFSFQYWHSNSAIYTVLVEVPERL